MHGQGDSFAFDTHLNESIPFSSPSDAKIARLVLTFDLPLKTVDLFLNIVNDETFKSSEVSIHQAKDIYQHVSEFRAKRAMVRANQPLRRPGLFSSEANARALSVATTPFPLLIVDLVIEELMRQFVTVLSPGPDRCTERKFYLQHFSAMSLVHRSWTIPAQHSLVYLIKLDLNVSEQMRTFACSPFPLMWTRRLSILLTCLEHDDDEHRPLGHREYFYRETRKRPNRLDGCQLINLALPHFANLQHLTIKFIRGIGDDYAMPYGLDILRQVSNFASLQELCVDFESWELLLMICTMLPNLQRLRKFTARSYGESPYMLLANAHEKLYGLAPPGSLECVSFDMEDLRIDPIPRILEWLTRPRKDWSLKSFCLDHKGWGAPELTFLQTKQVFDAIHMALPHLSSLELHSLFPKEDVDSVRGADVLRMILQNCTSLNRLAVCLQLMRQREGVIPDYVSDILMEWAPPTLRVILLKHNHEICCLFDETEHAFVRY